MIMTLINNIQAVIECNFSQTKEEIQEISTKRIYELIENNVKDLEYKNKELTQRIERFEKLLDDLVNAAVEKECWDEASLYKGILISYKIMFGGDNNEIL